MEAGDFEPFFIEHIKEMKERITKLKEEQIYFEGKLKAYEHSLETLKQWKKAEASGFKIITG
jgi:hypothetical protein